MRRPRSAAEPVVAPVSPTDATSPAPVPVDGAPTDPAASTPDESSQPTAILDLLRHFPDYRTLWFGTIATQGAQWVLQVALGWLMLELTDSELWVGMIGFAGGLPMLLVSVPSGVLIDRRNRRTILIICQAALLLLSVVLTVMVLGDVIQAWHLLAAAAINGALLTLNNLTRQTLLVATVPRSDLASGIALQSAGQNATRIVGPSLAGVLIGLVGTAGAFGFQSVLLLGAMVLSVTGLASLRHSSPRTTSGGILDGFGIIWNSPVLRGLMALATVPMLIVFPYLSLMPVYARDILDIGPQGLGLLMAASGVGAVLGALIVVRIARMPRNGWFMLASTMGYSGVVLVFAYSTYVPLSMLMLALGSLTGSAYMSLNNSLLQLQVDDAVRGRVMGVYMLTWGLMPLGSLPMGVAADLFGAPHAIAAGAILSTVLTALLAWRSPALRAL